MNRFTHQKLADMHLACGETGESGSRVKQDYEDESQKKKPASSNVCACASQSVRSDSLCSNIQDTEKKRLIWTFNVKVLQFIDDNPSISIRIRAIAQQLRFSHSAV